MDFITSLHSSNSCTAILMVNNPLPKNCHFAPLKSNHSSLKVAEVFMSLIVRLHGSPKVIVSDRDKVFTGKFGNNSLN